MNNFDALPRHALKSALCTLLSPLLTSPRLKYTLLRDRDCFPFPVRRSYVGGHYEARERVTKPTCLHFRASVQSAGGDSGEVGVLGAK